MKSDAKEVANSKRSERSKIQKEIRAHMLDADYFDSHDLLRAVDILPTPRHLYRRDAMLLLDNDAVDLTDVMVDVEDDGVGSDVTGNRNGVRKLIVGKVPMHQRVNMMDMVVGDMVCLTFTDTKDKQQLGVGQIVDPAGMGGEHDFVAGNTYIHWWESSSKGRR